MSLTQNKKTTRASVMLQLDNSIYDAGKSKNGGIKREGAFPATIDLKEIKNKRSDQKDFCSICEDKFKVIKNPLRHCKRCALPVCVNCSESFRQLSLDDEKEYRVCDQCDTIMDNWRM